MKETSFLCCVLISWDFFFWVLLTSALKAKVKNTKVKSFYWKRVICTRNVMCHKYLYIYIYIFYFFSFFQIKPSTFVFLTLVLLLKGFMSFDISSSNENVFFELSWMPSVIILIDCVSFFTEMHFPCSFFCQKGHVEYIRF